ncbi:hypothetical protein ACI48D_12400 [Massilia sp. LXY-6]|uniref:hypothetical protein n=1 Tax=Massilia sp. LXY-6 TaxID=3379823 RepID=UPI003EE18310
MRNGSESSAFWAIFLFGKRPERHPLARLRHTAQRLDDLDGMLDGRRIASPEAFPRAALGRFDT